MIPSLPKINKLSFSNSVSKSVNSSESATLWTPLNLDLELVASPTDPQKPAIWNWFQADSGVSTGAGGAVDSWESSYSTTPRGNFSDQFYYLVQNFANNKPLLEENVSNGKPAITFSGSSNLQYLEDGDVPIESKNKYQIYLVLGLTGSQNTTQVIVRAGGSASYDIAFLSNQQTAYPSNEWEEIYINGTEIPSPYEIRSQLTNNGLNIIRLNNIDNTHEGYLDAFTLGASNNGMQGRIAEVINFNRASTNTQFGYDPRPTGYEQKIEGYLAHKYGIQSKLPSDHPYKSAAPTT